eukprot:15369911-Alexandrium_andersonii.AAC.1
MLGGANTRSCRDGLREKTNDRGGRPGCSIEIELVCRSTGGVIQGALRGAARQGARMAMW